MSPDPYQPIDCGLHDELQLRALRRRPVNVEWASDGGEQRSARVIVVDVLTRGSEEFLRFDDGTEIRLDRLVRVDGIDFGGCGGPLGTVV